MQNSPEERETLARDVGAALGYAYPDVLDAGVVAHGRQLQRLPPDAESFG